MIKKSDRTKLLSTPLSDLHTQLVSAKASLHLGKLKDTSQIKKLKLMISIVKSNLAKNEKN